MQDSGFQIHRSVFSAEETAVFVRESDRLQAALPTACIRNLRSKSPTFQALALDPRLLALVPPVSSSVRSILFDKTPEQNWPVAWHQDLTIAVERQSEIPGYGPWSVKDGVPHVQPPTEVLESMMTLRIHLDPTPATNGALRVIPNSHRRGRIPPGEIADGISDEQVVCECGPGDVLAMSPLILHASSRSLTPGHRRVVHFEYAVLGTLHPELRFQES